MNLEKKVISTKSCQTRNSQRTGSSKTDYIDEDSSKVRGVRPSGDSQQQSKRQHGILEALPEVDTKCIVIPPVLLCVIQVGNHVMAPTDNIVFCDLEEEGEYQHRTRGFCRAYHDASDRAEEDRVGGEVRSETVAVLKQVPREHAETDDCSNISSPADVLVKSRKDSSQSQTDTKHGGWFTHDEAREESSKITTGAD